MAAGERNSISLATASTPRPDSFGKRNASIICALRSRSLEFATETASLNRSTNSSSY